MVSLFFVIATLIEFAIVLLIKQVREEGSNGPFIRPTESSKETRIRTPIFPNVDLRDAKWRTRGQGGVRNVEEQGERVNVVTKKVGVLGGMSLIKKIDYTSFVLFNTSYLMYIYFYFEL